MLNKQVNMQVFLIWLTSFKSRIIISMSTEYRIMSLILEKHPERRTDKVNC